jgi:hypothetical protein
MTMDNNDDDDDNDNDNNDKDDDKDEDDDSSDGNGNNKNSTIKQCMGVRKRRKKVAAMDDKQRQKWRLLWRNSTRGINEEECMTMDNS